MNLFQQYGIKEVADVTFYSINRVGDEEFYTPVLYLDTLKVSTIEKKNQIADSYGGYGNQKLASWNFNKTITLKLEDALFSPASMSLLWGGQLEAKFSKYTSAIVKINIANKYGKLNYSTKAYPSPTLTTEEWGVIFEACNELNKSFIYINNQPIKFYVAPASNAEYVEENRILLQRSYYNRNFKEIFEESMLRNLDGEIGTWNDSFNWHHSIEQENIAIPDCITAQILLMIQNLKDLSDFKTSIYDLDVIDRMEKCVVKDKDGLQISTTEQKKNLLKYFLNDKTSSYTIYYDIKTMLPLLSTDEDGEIIGWEDKKDLRLINSNNISLTINLNYDYTSIIEKINEGEWKCTLSTFCECQYDAGFSSKLFFIKKISVEANKTLLWGYDKEGMIRIIPAPAQEEELPFDFADNVKIIHSSNDDSENISEDFEPGHTYPEKTNIFRLRIGTPYLKWTRTVKEENQYSKDSLGKTFIINSDAFPGQYRLACETYIRDRNGKDQRYQIIIPRVQITADTNITLQAEGDPSVFSMSIDVFTPPNDIMMELRQYDVTEDQIHGGTKIVPQKEQITRTQTIQNYGQIEKIENEVFY